jgi:ribosomal subunit interface protein
MRITHYEKNATYTPDEMLMIARKIGKLATYCERVKDEASLIRLETIRRSTKKEQDQIKVMITVELPKSFLRAESRRPNVVEAIDRCIEKLEPQIKKYKELHTRRGRVQKMSRRAKKSKR